MSKTCTHPNHSHQRCGRDIVAGNRCICHLDDRNKDKDLLRHAIALVFETKEDVLDFHGFVFNINNPFEYRDINKTLILSEAKFYDKFELNQEIVDHKVDFSLCVFLSDVSFTGIEFTEDFFLEGLDLKVASFRHSLITPLFAKLPISIGLILRSAPILSEHSFSKAPIFPNPPGKDLQIFPRRISIIVVSGAM